MDWFKRLVKPEKSTTSDVSKNEIDKGNQLDEATLLAKLNPLWKSYEDSRKDKDFYCAHKTFLDLYNGFKTPFKSIKDNFSEVSNSYAYITCRFLQNHCEQIVSKDYKGKTKKAKNHSQNYSPKDSSEILMKITTDISLESLRAIELCQFMEENQLILSVLLILTQELQSFDVFVNAKLPICLIKTFQALLHLPKEAISKEITAILHTLVNLLLQLCSSALVVQDLIKSDTLRDLFVMSVIYSSNNCEIREMISPIVSSVIKCNFNVSVSQYLRSNDSVGTIMGTLSENLDNYTSLDLFDVVEILLSIIEESAKLNSDLLDEFNNSQGYSLLTQSLLYMEVKENGISYGMKLLDFITDFIFVGTDDIVLEFDQDNLYSPVSVIKPDGQKIYVNSAGAELKCPTIMVTNKRKRVRNTAAYQVLQNYFLSTQKDDMKDKVLECIAKVFSLHEENYYLLQHQRSVAHIIESIPEQSQGIQSSIQKLILSIITGLNVVPYFELSSMCSVLQESIGHREFGHCKLCLDTFKFTLAFDGDYRPILTKQGLFNILLETYRSFVEDESMIQKCEDAFRLFLLETMGLMYEMMVGNIENVKLFREIEIVAYQRLINTQFRVKTLKLMEVVVLEDSLSLESNFDILMTFCNSDDLDRIKDIIFCVNQLLDKVTELKTTFNTTKGPDVILFVLSLLDNKLEKESEQFSEYMQLYDLTLTMLTKSFPRSLFDEDYNNVFYGRLLKAIANTRIMNISPDFIFRWGFNLSTLTVNETFAKLPSNNSSSEYEEPYFGLDIPIAFRPKYLHLFLDLISQNDKEELIIYIIGYLKILIELCGTIANCELIASTEILLKLQNLFKKEFLDPSGAIYPYFQKILVLLGSYKVSTQELINIFKYTDPSYDRVHLKSYLESMLSIFQTQSHLSTPFFYFDHSNNENCAVSTDINSIAWPPSDGFTLSLWCYFDRITPDDLNMISVRGSRDTTLFNMEVVLRMGQLVVIIQDNDPLIIESFNMSSRKWYHIAIVYERNRLYSSETRVYIDGIARSQRKENLGTSQHLNLQIMLANKNLNIKKETMTLSSQWRLGPLYLLDHVFTGQDVFTIFNLGPNYVGMFQGSLTEYFGSEHVNFKNLQILEELSGHDLKDIDSFIRFGFSQPIAQERILLSLNAAKEIVDSKHNYLGGELKDCRIKAVSLTPFPGVNRLLKMSGKTSPRSGTEDSSPTNTSLSMKQRRSSTILFDTQLEDFSEEKEYVSHLSYESESTPVPCWPLPMSCVLNRFHFTEILLFQLEYAYSVDVKHSDEVNGVDESLSFVALQCIQQFLRQNQLGLREFEKHNGFSAMAYILKKNPLLMSVEKLDILLEFAGLTKANVAPQGKPNSPRESNISTSIISNVQAFKHFVIDYTTWILWKPYLKTYMFERLQYLFLGNPYYRFNGTIIHRLNVLSCLITVLKSKDADSELYPSIITFIGNILLSDLQIHDLRLIANFIMSAFSEQTEMEEARFSNLRTMLIYIVYTVLLESQPSLFSKVFDCEWMLMFFHNEKNIKSVELMLKILGVLFKEKQKYANRFISENGMVILEESLKKFHDKVEIYFILFCILLGKLPSELPDNITEFTSFTEIFPPQENGYEFECKQVLPLILTLIKENHTYFLEHMLAQQEEINVTIQSTFPLEELSGSPRNSPQRRRARSCLITNQGEENPFSLKRQNDIEKIKSQTLVRKSSLGLSAVGALRKAIKGRQKKERSSSIVSLPQQTSNETIVKLVPLFIHVDSIQSFFDLPIQPRKKATTGLMLAKNAIMFIKDIFSFSFHFQDLIRKHEFLLSIVSIIFPSGKLSIMNTNMDKIDLTELDHFGFLVLDLITHIIVELVAYNPSFRDTKLLDEIFELALPYNIQKTDESTFNNMILQLVLARIKDTFRKVFASNPRTVLSTAKLCNYCIDKVLTGSFTKGFSPLLSFFIECLHRRDRFKGILDPIIKNANRLILIVVFGVTKSKDKTKSCKILSRILANQKLLFTVENNDREFYSCFCKMMFNLLFHEDEKVSTMAIGIWKMILLSGTDILNFVFTIKKPGSTVDILQGFQLVFNNDSNAFYEWIRNNRSAIEDCFDESTEKNWRSFLFNEDRISRDRVASKKRNKLSSKKRTDKRRSQQQLILNTFNLFKNRRFTHIVGIEQERFNDYVEGVEDRNNYMSKLWATQRLKVFEESEIWGPKVIHHPLQKWKQEDTENTLRMRLKLKRNHDFYSQYTHIATPLRASVQGPDIYPTPNPQSLDTKKFLALSEEDKEIVDRNVFYAKRVSKIQDYEKGYYNSPQLLYTRKKKIDADLLEDDLYQSDDFSEILSNESDNESDVLSQKSSGSKQTSSQISNVSEEETEEITDITLENQESEFSGDSDDENPMPLEEVEYDHKITRFLVPGDTPQHMFNASKVEGLDRLDGIFIICQQCVYFIGNFSLSTDSISASPLATAKKLKPNSDEIIFSLESFHEVRKWPFPDIKKVLKRRYLLKSIALEIFSVDGRNSLLIFEKDERDLVFEHLNSAIRFIHQDNEDLSLSQITELWSQGHITNFDYLMRLNTIAGRSYNDLTQYPIFPWILSDYTSDNIDLNDPSVYRDLSKPMGAIGEERKLKFYERFEDLDPSIQPFFFGSHYSSAAIVLYYLIRMEPFTQHFLKLQGGTFDRPDRLFDSIHETWLSASQENMMDVKELIPEFFYLPEIFLNSNKFLFGKKQSGEFIDDVMLPPWADNNPRKFVDMQRRALESPHVSKNLHHWIDLIFGYKQQGQAAKDAMNLFYYLTYEGAVDIDKIEDPTEKQATIDQINNFGQTPSQIFKKSHPKRAVIPSYSFLFSLEEDRISVIQIRQAHFSVGVIWSPSIADKVTLFESMKLIISPYHSKYIAWGYDDFCIRFWEGSKLVSSCSNIYHPYGYITCMAASSDGKCIVSGGTDGVVCTYNLEWDKRPKLFHSQEMKLKGHHCPIAQVAVSRSLSIVVSVDIGDNVVIWDLNTSQFMRTFKLHTISPNPPESRVYICMDTENGLIAISKGYAFCVMSVNGDLCGYRDFSKESIITSIALYISTSSIDIKTHFLTGHIDGSIRVFEYNDVEDISHTKECSSPRNLFMKHIFYKHTKAVTAMCFAFNGKRLYTGDSMGYVLRWEEKKVIEKLT